MRKLSFLSFYKRYWSSIRKKGFIRMAKPFKDTGCYMVSRGLVGETKAFCDLGLLIG